MLPNAEQFMHIANQCMKLGASSSIRKGTFVQTMALARVLFEGEEINEGS